MTSSIERFINAKDPFDEMKHLIDTEKVDPAALAEHSKVYILLEIRNLLRTLVTATMQPVAPKPVTQSKGAKKQ